MLRTNGAAMNKYIGQQFAALRYEKNILVVEETTSAGGCGSFNAASSCPASACLYDSAAWGIFYCSERGGGGGIYQNEIVRTGAVTG